MSDSKPTSTGRKPAASLPSRDVASGPGSTGGALPGSVNAFGYREKIGPHGEFIMYEPTIEELMRERMGNVPPVPPIAAPQLERGTWKGYREYIGPHGEFVLYQPSIDELIEEGKNGEGMITDGPSAGNKTPHAHAPQAHAPQQHPAQEQASTRKPGQGSKAGSGSEDHPHTVARPPAEPDDDVDKQLLRHREWLRHRFDSENLPPQPTIPHTQSKPDRNAPGSYKRLRDDADETAARIKVLEDERKNSWLPDDLWDMLFGQELRIQLVHLRSIQWQIEEFEKAYAAGDDPVAAVNKYNHEQWEIFLNALNEHIRLIGGAIMNVEAMRAFQKAIEEALEMMKAARQRQNSDWLRQRERARLEADKARTNTAAGGTKANRRIGGLTQREWDNVINRNRVNKLKGAEADAAREARLKEFSQDTSNGQLIGTATREADGSVTVRYGVNRNLMGDELCFDGPYTESIPAGQVPPGLEFGPNGVAPICIFNETPR